jgi:threonyl-tRNA synthetase
VGDDNKDHQPYMVHRALFGSIERFFGILTEHYTGAFPLWLAPEQVRVLPLTDKQLDAGRAIMEQLQALDFRVGLDSSNEKVGAKIRNAQLMKVPYMLILGPRDVTAGQVSVRSRSAGDLGAMPLDAFIARLREEETSKGLAAPVPAMA